jgi:hypothetical protein
MLSTGSVAMYPVTYGHAYATAVLRSVNDKEQRWAERAPLADFILPFTDISAADLATVKSFINTQMGQLDKTWSITIDGVAYSNMTFIHDDFAYTENKPNLWSFTLRARQVRKN